MNIRVDRCLCTGRTFADLVEEAREEGWSLDELARATGASASCGLCRPYLKRAMRTGEVVFTELLSEDEA
jgi:bacterioferritin-associated ferredoxin